MLKLLWQSLLSSPAPVISVMILYNPCLYIPYMILVSVVSTIFPSIFIDYKT